MKDVYQLTDLESRERLDEGEDKPAKLAVIGWPVAHSASPQMHQPALDALGIHSRYIRVEVPEGRCPEAFDRMRELGFIGCNITVPHKFAALAYCDEIDATAEALGTVNTIRFDKSINRGFNTDGPGFANAIEQEFGCKLENMDVVIAGAAGGAGQAIATHSMLAGVRKLVLINRTRDKLDLLVEHLHQTNPKANIVPLGFDSPDLAMHCRSSQLIINTSSVGLKEGDGSILPAECLKTEHWIYDTIYQPSRTPLLELAEKIGAKTANGLSMLIHQGAISFQHWFNGTEPMPFMRQAVSPQP